MKTRHSMRRRAIASSQPNRGGVRIDPLEHRTLFSTFTVTNTLDAGTNSLRAAIVLANAHAGSDTIAFNIPGTGLHTIRLESGLPQLTDALTTIDGYSQPGSRVNTSASGDNAVLRIELDGENISRRFLTAPGLDINAKGCQVRGLIINRFSGVTSGIIVRSSNAIIQGNFIGLDSTGMTAPVASGFPRQEVGLLLANASACLIGGTAPAARNIISGNFGRNVEVQAGSSLNTVVGNFIGPNILNVDDGLIGAENSMLIHDSPDNQIGGRIAAARNVISNAQHGSIRIDGTPSVHNVVEGNTIRASGVVIRGASNNTIGGTEPGAGNEIFNAIIGPGDAHADGVLIASLGDVPSTGNAVIGNSIHNNDGSGVSVGEFPEDLSAGNTILGNSIFSNTGLGIDLGDDGPTDNAPVNPAAGPNHRQNFPVVTSSATTLAGRTTITFTLASAPLTVYRIEFFSNPTVDASGLAEGRTFLGAMDVITAADGTLRRTTFVPRATVPVGQVITATATNLTDGTSEFSRPRAVARAVEIGSSFMYDTLPQNLWFTFAEDVSKSIGIEDLYVLNMTTGKQVSAASLDYDSKSNTAIFSFADKLPDGRYRAFLDTPKILSQSNNEVPGDPFVFDFFFLDGDVNHDGVVNVRDLFTVARNFNEPGGFSDGDANYDGKIDVKDLLLVLQNFGHKLSDV